MQRDERPPIDFGPALLELWARELGLTGLRPRPVERYPSPPAWIVTRVAHMLAEAGCTGPRALHVVAPPSPDAALDPWRVESAMLGLSVAALLGSGPDDGLALAVHVDADEAIFQVVSTGAAWSRLLAHHEPAGTRLALDVARRAADDQGGRLELAVEPRYGAAARLRLPMDPERPCRAARRARGVPSGTPAFASVHLPALRAARGAS